MEFSNSTEFINRLKGIGLLAEHNNLNMVLNLYNNLGNGCKCSFQNRVNALNAHINDLPNKISQTEKEFLKSSLNADIISIVGSWTLNLV